jgi:hypothetical protein
MVVGANDGALNQQPLPSSPGHAVKEPQHAGNLWRQIRHARRSRVAQHGATHSPHLRRTNSRLWRVRIPGPPRSGRLAQRGASIAGQHVHRHGAPCQVCLQQQARGSAPAPACRRQQCHRSRASTFGTSRWPFRAAIRTGERRVLHGVRHVPVEAVMHAHSRREGPEPDLSREQSARRAGSYRNAAAVRAYGCRVR